MGFAALEMVAVSMVNGMTARPAVVRNQQGAVQNKSDDSFNPPVRVKSVMAAFVSQHPAAHGDGAGDSGVDQPKWDGLERQRNGCTNANSCKGKAHRHRQTSPGFARIEGGEVSG